jgi:cell division protein FtsL
MTIVLAIVLAALIVALYFIRVSHQHAAVISSLDDLSGRTQPVDLEAFRNLIDPAQTAYLRQSLPSTEFRNLHRERTHVAAEYVQRIAQNAAVLLRLGQAARHHADPEIARAAQAMVERALVVRMIAMEALIKLRVQSFFPGIEFSTSEVFERYRRLTESVALFTRLQRPAFSSHVLAML